VAACGEYPAKKLLAKWGKLSRHFVPLYLGQRHCRLSFEVSQAPFAGLENSAFTFVLFAF
jgi:hypothetical protein